MLATVVITVATLWLAASAAAQEPGVKVDPDSPAGVEYAVPLEKVRREAAGGSPGQRSAGRRSAETQPLFGVGIEDQVEEGGADAAAASDGERPSGSGGEPRGAEGDGGGSDLGRNTPPGQRSTAAVKAASSGGSESLLTVGIAAGVLAIGLALGFGLRKLLRGT